ncbi:hypothetical protein ACOMHN_041272 [Nucella lapillus]
MRCPVGVRNDFGGDGDDDDDDDDSESSRRYNGSSSSSRGAAVSAMAVIKREGRWRGKIGWSPDKEKGGALCGLFTKSCAAASSECTGGWLYPASSPSCPDIWAILRK